MKVEREQTTLRVPAKLKDMLEMEADKLGVSINSMALIILQEYQPLNDH